MKNIAALKTDWRGLLIPLAALCFGAAGVAAWLAQPSCADCAALVLPLGLEYIFDDYRDRAFYVGFCLAVFLAAWPAAYCSVTGEKQSLWGKINGWFMVLAVAVLWFFQKTAVHAYFGWTALFFAAAAGWAVCRPECGVLLARAETLWTERFGSFKPWAALTVAVLFCLWGLLPAIYTERALGPSFFNVYNHIPFTMAEFAAVLNGRTPLVDFFPQYQIISPYVLYPVFKMTGFSVLTYTCVVSAVGLAGLLCGWLALRKVTSEGRALFLFLIFAATAFYPDQRKGDEIYYMFNYYAMPLRYFGPWLLTLTTVWAAEKPEVHGRLYLHAAAAAFVAFNNFDFGIAPCAASWCALMVVRRDRARVFVAYAAALAAVAAGLCLLCFARAGALPDFARLADFHRLFGLCGFMAAPMPVLGAHIIMLGVFAAALICGLNAARDNAKLAGLLVYGGVFGLGAFAYYAGRSLPGTLLFVFPAWVLCTILLWLRVKERAADGSGCFKWFLTAHLALFACSAGLMANPIGQFKRIVGGDDRFAGPYRQMLAVVRGAVRPGEKAGIMCLNGHRLALDAGVSNVFPFASQDAVVLWKQAELAASVMAAQGADRLLGPVPPEMEAMLRRAGYVKMSGQDMWSRAAGMPLTQKN